VNPVKVVDGQLPPVAPSSWERPQAALLLIPLTVAMLAAILIAWIYAPAGGGGFIYQNF